MKSLLLVSFLTGNAFAQATAYAQCGGRNWTGDTTCVDGYTCKSWNEWYSQCVTGDASDSSPTTAVKTTIEVPATSQETTAEVPATTLKTSTKVATTAQTTSATTNDAQTTNVATAVPSSTNVASPGSLKWLGVDESVAEFGESNYPGVWGTHFIFPDESTIGVRIGLASAIHSPVHG